MNIKAAIIGANSYIARNMVQINLTANYADVYLYGYQPEHMDGVPGYAQIDLTQEEAVEKAIFDCDLIYFFVGKTGTLQGFDIPDMFLDVNEKLLFCLLKTCKRTKTKAKIVFPSTRLVYQGSEYALAEDAKKQFLTPYAIQKYACEQYLEMYHRLYGVNYCILRIGVPYGTLVHPVSSYGTLDFFLNQAFTNRQINVYGSGKQRRTFTYIEDLCHILWEAGLNSSCVNDIYNVCGEDYSIMDIAEKIAQATASSVVEREWPPDALKVESGSTVFNSEKLDKLLKYSLSMSVDKWVKRRIIK